MSYINEGDVIGVRTAISEPFYIGKRQYVLCRCRCGSVRSVRCDSLGQGKSGGCPCVSITHGHARVAGESPTYNSWRMMRNRCLNPNDPQYQDYGGRGIGIAAAWVDSFDAFLKDMGTRPSLEYTIDRLDNDANYSPGNCRWATWNEQHRNKRTNHRVTINGRTQILTDWCREYGIAESTVCARIARGMTPVDAITVPVQKKFGRRHVAAN